MPANPNRFNPNPKRTTLSAPSDPRTDPRPQKAVEEEEKTRVALSDLRRKNTDLNEGIRSLEAAIGEPAFRRLMEQVTSAESSSIAFSTDQEPSSSVADDPKRLHLERCRKLLGPRLNKLAAESKQKDQKVHFTSMNAREIRPKLFYAEWDWHVYVSIIGPSDIRKRSSGSLRIADQILSLDTLLIGESSVPGEDKNRQKPWQKNAEQTPTAEHQNGAKVNASGEQQQQQQCLQRVREFTEKYLEAAAAKEPPNLVLGLLRQCSKIMAVSHMGKSHISLYSIPWPSFALCPVL